MYRFLLIALIILIFPASTVHAVETETILIEVEGDVMEHRSYIKTYHPFIEVVETYSVLFNGLALQGKPENLKRLHTEDFIKSVHQVQTYGTMSADPGSSNDASTYTDVKLDVPPQLRQIPVPVTGQTSDRFLHTTAIPKATTPEFTGKNVKVAVIDTGIDYNHPDLKENFSGGFDVFDFDPDPMETLPEEGMPTNHGTHVAGIIAANGELKGVAPDASIHAYRALGPGGFGTTVHVLAALEQAVNDDVDIINLSLGNSVNGPDYPTSTAVNKAVELGIPVVIANGNSGPHPWTVGSPATASKALSVGAAQPPTRVPYLFHPREEKQIPLSPMQGAPDWNLEKDYALAIGESEENVRGKIVLVQRSIVTFRDLALEAQEKGAVALLIYNDEAGSFLGAVDNSDDAIEIPVAGLSAEDGEWLLNHAGDYVETEYDKLELTIADFSSRGPVTVNWQIKPDLAAPGTNVNSTVPGGYEHFSGTSMAAPYVAGSIALLKEAHPDWNVEKIYSALKTTAQPLFADDGSIHPPSVQGHGIVQPDEALTAPTIIYNGTLEAGKISNRQENKKFTITVENRTSETQRFTFDVPKQQKGIRWKVPLAFIVPPHESEEIDLELKVRSYDLPLGIHEGFLQLIEKTTNKSYHLPYLLINQLADQPKIAGVEFSLKPLSEDMYKYSLYITEPLQSLTIDLYEQDMLAYRGNLLRLDSPDVGMNEGDIPQYELTPGSYLGLITAITMDGEVEIEEVPIYID